VISREMKLGDAPEGYKMFRDKQNECLKVVLKT
jgi:threonine dehydrogenase-like Zn-dependent dehydrogenase